MSQVCFKGDLVNINCLTNIISIIQDCIMTCQTITLHYICHWVYFDLSLTTDGKCKSASAIALECVLTTVSMIGLALLGWSSFEIDPVQINGKCILYL